MWERRPTVRARVGSYKQWLKRWHCQPQVRGLTGIKVRGTIAWAYSPSGIFSYEGEEWRPIQAPFDDCVKALLVENDGSLRVIADSSLWHLTGGKWVKEGDAPEVNCWAAASDGSVWAIGDGYLWRRQHQWDPIVKVPSGVQVRCIACWEDQVAVATDWGLWFLQGKRPHFKELIQGYTKLPTDDIREAIYDRWGHLWLATDRGVVIVCGGDGFLWLKEDDGVPILELTGLALGSDGSLWLASAYGAMALIWGQWHYFASPRWLPGDRVVSVGVLETGEAIVATNDGIAHLIEKEMTLREKAQQFGEQVKGRHWRFGYVTTRGLASPGDPATGRVHISDNDGLWTALYAAAELFHYKTAEREGKSEEAQEALRAATESLKAVLFLEKVTGIPGFPARAVRNKTEPEFCQPHPEWHLSEDGQWEWKGDTSSDEIVGHFFVYWVAYELMPDGELKTELVATAQRVMDHIINHHWYLIDCDGQATTWGVWAPERLNHDETWWGDRGLNSLELLSFLKATYRMTGEKRYETLYKKMIQDHHYALNTVKQKIVIDGLTNHSDDQLAFLSYYVLLRTEDDLDLRRLYVASISRTWQLEKAERCPLWNFVYGAVTGKDCAVEESVRTLQEIPMDLVHWTVRNSHRADIRFTSRPGRFGEKQAELPLPFTERPMHKWNGNPYRLDGGSDGRVEEDPTFFLLPYWMGRFFGLITED